MEFCRSENFRIANGAVIEWKFCWSRIKFLSSIFDDTVSQQREKHHRQSFLFVFSMEDYTIQRDRCLENCRIVRNVRTFVATSFVESFLNVYYKSHSLTKND